MKKIFVSTDGIGDWKKKLGDPDLHWQRGRSAFECAVSWEAADKKHGVPNSICSVLNNSSKFKDPELLLAIPEHVVPLKGRGKGSQNDVWGLFKFKQKIFSVSVEAKAGENFDKTVKDWLNKDSKKAGRKERLKDLKSILQIEKKDTDNIRYQLLHRCVSAILEARRFQSDGAMMIIQSFSEFDSFDDFSNFCDLFGIEAERNIAFHIESFREMPLYLCWVDSELASDAEVAMSVS
jgi:hypothetical protein